MNAVTSWYNLGYSKQCLYGMQETDHHRLQFWEAALLVVPRKKTSLNFLYELAWQAARR
jgi:hypothetical protein